MLVALAPILWVPFDTADCLASYNALAQSITANCHRAARMTKADYARNPTSKIPQAPSHAAHTRERRRAPDDAVILSGWHTVTANAAGTPP
jgi:hypothetical protein